MLKINQSENLVRIIFYGCLLIFGIVNFTPRSTIDERLQNYYNSYMTIIEKNCNKNKYFTPLQQFISIGELNAGEVAVCRYNFLTRYTIIFNVEYFNRMNKNDIEVTMWHELTHCLFFEPHSDDPEHYMFAYQNSVPKYIATMQLERFLKEKCK